MNSTTLRALQMLQPQQVLNLVIETQKELNTLLQAELENKEQGRTLKDFLVTLDDSMLYTYIVKDFYNRQYVFDKQDQLKAMSEGHKLALHVFSNEKTLQAYLDNHDGVISNHWNRQRNDLRGTVFNQPSLKGIFK